MFPQSPYDVAKPGSCIKLLSIINHLFVLRKCGGSTQIRIFHARFELGCVGVDDVGDAARYI